jgi:excisionase family DNA binding protein
MTKQEAANHLGVSVRALERYTQQSRIAARYEKGRTRPTIIYDESEVERFKAELEKVKHKPALEVAGGIGGRLLGEGNTFEAGAGLNFANDANLANTLATSGDIAPLALLFAQFVRAVQNGAPFNASALPALPQGVGEGSGGDEMSEQSRRAPKAHTPTADKILLGVEDAMSLTTLSRAVILGAVKTGQLPAQKFGRAWKIKRRDLDAFVDNL